MTEKSSFKRTLDMNPTSREAVVAVESGNYLSNSISSKNRLSIKNLSSILGIVIALALAFGGCNKSDEMINNAQVTEQKVKIPIAKLTKENGITLLFLQKDAQEFFYKENPDKKLVFAEVIDCEKDGKKAKLLYRIYDAKNKIAETTMCSGLILVDDFYYLPPSFVIKVTCTTSECADEQLGCFPDDFACTKCGNGGKCTKTISNDDVLLGDLSVPDAIHSATSVYPMVVN